MLKFASSKKTTSAVIAFTLILGFNQAVTWAEDGPRDVIAKHGVVSAAHPFAAKAGVEVLKKGGNAFDAAIATSFMLNVVEPHTSGVGGGGFAMIYVAKEQKAYMVDYREIAPYAAKPDSYLDSNGKVVPGKSTTGLYASGVPGHVKGMEFIAQKFGTMKLSELIAPAIKQSEQGLPVYRVFNDALMSDWVRLDKFTNKDDFERFKSVYFSKDGMPLQVGDTVLNKDITKTLKKIARHGSDVFYKGEIAEKITDYYAKNGNSWITKQDLAEYQVTMREPVKASYRGYELITSAPPSSGGMAIASILNLMEAYDVKAMGPQSPEFAHKLIQAQKLAYADRAQYMADTDFVQVPQAGLISKAYAAERRLLITDQVVEKYQAGEPNKYESGSTTSFSVVDKDGNMITITQTINSFFGSGVIIPGTGFLMNNEMDDFTTNSSVHVNAPAPKKKPLSSMSPTIVLKDGAPFMTLGSPGGPRIISTVASVIMNVLDFDMDMQSAIDHARLYSPNSGLTHMETPFSDEYLAALEKQGHKIKVYPKKSTYFGGVHGVKVLEDGQLHGAADPRRFGQAAGY